MIMTPKNAKASLFVAMDSSKKGKNATMEIIVQVTGAIIAQLKMDFIAPISHTKNQYAARKSSKFTTLQPNRAKSTKLVATESSKALSSVTIKT